MRSAKTATSLSYLISLRCRLKKLGYLVYKEIREDALQTVQTYRLIWVFAGRTCPKGQFLPLRLCIERICRNVTLSHQIDASKHHHWTWDYIKLLIKRAPDTILTVNPWDCCQPDLWTLKRTRKHPCIWWIWLHIKWHNILLVSETIGSLFLRIE